MKPLEKSKKFTEEIRKLYSNLKRIKGLKDIVINMDENYIGYSLRDLKDNDVYSQMCCKIKKTVKYNHPDIVLICNPPEGCKNPHSLEKQIVIEVNKEITNPENKQEVLYHALVDFNGILKRLPEYIK
ncbi:MAG: hypothetical protein WCX73_02115 [Candidatus Pacearchaeota archaeon]|jgi:hypothetical protein